MRRSTSPRAGTTRCSPLQTLESVPTPLSTTGASTPCKIARTTPPSALGSMPYQLQQLAIGSVGSPIGGRVRRCSRQRGASTPGSDSGRAPLCYNILNSVRGGGTSTTAHGFMLWLWHGWDCHREYVSISVNEPFACFSYRWAGGFRIGFGIASKFAVR